MNRTFKEYYIEEGILDTVSDISKTVAYFSNKFWMISKSKNKKAKLIEILREMKEEYNHYYISFMNKVYEVVYSGYKRYKRDVTLRTDIQIFIMLLMSIASIPLTLNAINALYPVKHISDNIKQHHEEIVKHLEDIKKSVDEPPKTDEKELKFDVNDLGF
jgi:hypothetical protein